MEKTRYYPLNTVIGDRLAGNPTPVFLYENPVVSKTMAAMARDFSYPVSVFVQVADGGRAHQIRYFTVTGEIPACGHGILGKDILMVKQASARGGQLVVKLLEDAVKIGGNCELLEESDR